MEALESMMQISENYEFIASVVGDIVDTPHQLSGLDIEQERQSTLRELIIKQGIIK